MPTRLRNCILLILLGIVLSGCTTQVGPHIKLSVESFDLGDIDPDAGVRTETFFVENTGTLPLEIESVSTSCGCTSAEVSSNTIPPGERTELTVQYDPSVHPGLVGDIKRVVYIQSNDPLNEEVELELVGTSIPSILNADDHDEGLLKEFEISPAAVYRKMLANEPIKLLDVREDFEYGEGHLEGTDLLPVTEITQQALDKLGFSKDDEIIVYCRSGTRSARAYEILTALGYTNVKSMSGGIIHWAEEGFSVENGSGAASTVKSSLSFDRLEHDFGIIPQFGGKVNTTFVVANTGGKDVSVTSVSTSCGCTSADIADKVLKSGESTNLIVVFDPNLHAEPLDRFSRTVFIETSDGTESELKIWVDILEGE